jgi:charged multivesicular body protein 6
MGGIFEKGNNTSRITEQDKVLLNLKKTRDQLKRYQRKIEGNLENDREFAKLMLKEGKKDKAKLLLRKKKYQESLLTRTNGQLDKLDTLVYDLEYSQVERQVLDELKEGNEALKKANEMFSIEEIEQIMDDTAEAAEKQREIEAILSGQLTEDEEDDVLKELDELIGNAPMENEESYEEIPELPSVPSDKLTPEKKVEKERKSKATKEKVLLEAS